MDSEKEQLNQKNQLQVETNQDNFLDKKLKSYIEFEEKWADALAKFLTNSFGTLRFLNLIIVIVFLWLVINLGLIPGVQPFDPNPFSWLMMIVQLFGIFLSIIVLISQRREERITEVYQKMDFEINVRAEHEITKILQMIEEIHKEMGIAKQDKELEQMKTKIDISEIKEHVESAIEEKNSLSDILS